MVVSMEINDFLEHKEEDTKSIALLKEFYAGKVWNTVYGALNMDAVTRLFVDSPSWHVCPGFPDGGSYYGRDEVFDTLYAENIRNRYSLFYGKPEVFIDGADVVTVLGFYHFAVNKGDPVIHARFSHTWKIAPDGRVEGVWQVADSYIIQQALNAE